MCGINGIVGSQDKLTSLVKRMNTKLVHRGPDATGIYQDNKLCLGHQRLSIIDLSEDANQPFVSPCKNYVLVFNGELYNYKELREKYHLACRTQSDAEVVLMTIARYGTKILSEFNGMFAFAFYDKKTKRLILGRDRLGIKPLYYTLLENKLYFSSELNPIKACLEGKLTINQSAIADFLHMGYIPSPNSIFNEVKKFPSGTSLNIDLSLEKIEEDDLVFSPFWKIEEQLKSDTLDSEEVAARELDRLINKSVDYRLNADVPFGTFLSGGIDSSLVTAIAQRNHQHQINSFSIGFEEKEKNESEFAKEVAKAIGTNHHEFIVTEKEAINLLPRFFEAYGEPYADTSAIPTMMVSKLARSEVKMTLSGDGGDELFHGYGFYQWANRLNKKRVKLSRKGIAPLLNMGDNRMKRASQMFLYPEDEMKSHIFSQEQYYFSKKELNQLLQKADYKNFATYNSSIDSPRKLVPEEEQSIFDIKHYLKDELLVKVDIASMQFGLEDRVPLLDHNIVEFALNLNPGLKIKNGEAKYLLKKVLYNYLDPSLFDRPKQGFSVPLAKWLKGELSYLIKDYLNEKMILKHNLVNWPVVASYLKRFYAGEDYLYTRIFALIVLHKWFEDQYF